jgi:iron complex outermembrane receptor protein
MPGPETVAGANAEVVVIAPRLEVPLRENPAATTVVSDETIARSLTKSIGAEEALALVPGVKVDNQADGERVHLSIRGQGLLTERGIRGIKVLLDGLPLNDPTGFAPDLFDVDWATVQRVEVFRGAASALFGGGGAGGILNITTRDGGEVPRGEAFLDVGSQGFWKAFAEASGKSGDVTYRVSGSRTMGDGYRDHTAYYATNLYGKFGLETGRTRLTLIVAGTSYFNENAEGLNAEQVATDRTMANPDALAYNERQQTRRGTVGLAGQTGLGEGGELAYSLYYRHTMWDEAVPSTVQHRTYDSPGAFLQYAFRFDTGALRHQVTVGSDLDGQSIADLKRPNLGGAQEGAVVVADQQISQSGVGLFALDRVDLGGG